MGRPKTDDPRDQQLNLSLTRAEMETLRTRARDRGMRPGEYGRALIFQQSRTSPAIAPRARVDLQFVHAVNRLGVNLNQIARRLNAAPVPMVPRTLEPLLADIRSLIDRELRRP
jgi:hypothetical protein